MTDNSDFREAYRAGRAAVEKRLSWTAFLGAGFGVVIGRILWNRYSLPWFEGAPIEILIVVVLAIMGLSIERRLRPGALVHDADSD
jgi:hypothetical protein